MITTRLVESEEDLREILALQRSQLPSQLAAELQAREGFTPTGTRPTSGRWWRWTWAAERGGRAFLAAIVEEGAPPGG